MEDSFADAVRQGDRKKKVKELESEIETFDPNIGDKSEFYHRMLNSLVSMTEGAFDLLSPKIREKTGISKTAQLKDLNALKKRIASIDKENKRESEDKNDPEENKKILAFLKDVEPWPTPVSTEELLDEIISTIKRFVILSEHELIAAALWVLHTWTFDASMISPILCIKSPQKRCGKSTLLSILADISYHALFASNISTASIFRTIEKYSPTLIIDEADTFINDNDELRGVLNSGHTKDTAYVIRVDKHGDKFEPGIFRTWGPKAIGLIGKLSDTLSDRSIIISMRRRTPDEKVERRRRDNKSEFERIKRRCRRWADSHISLLAIAEPDIPDRLNDRAADNWTPLFAIADLATGDWPDKARVAALAVSGADDESETIAVELLRDMRDIFEKHGDRLFTSFIITELCKIEESPWATFSKGKPISDRQLAKILKPFGILSTTVRNEAEVGKGYKKETFLDAFLRYIPPPASVTPLHSSIGAGLRDFLSVTSNDDVTDKNNGKSSIHAGCNVVTDRKGGIEDNICRSLFFNLENDKDNENDGRKDGVIRTGGEVKICS